MGWGMGISRKAERMTVTVHRARPTDGRRSNLGTAQARHGVPLLGALAVGLAVALSGCTYTPGFAIDVQKDTHAAVVASTLAATTITPELVSALRAERAALPAPAAPWDTPAAGEYRIGVQDRVHIAVWGHPDLSSGSGNVLLPQLGAAIAMGSGGAGVTAASGNANAPDRAVDDDGTVYMPLAGRVPAAGLTVTALRAALETALAPYLHTPQVEVQLTGYFSQRVFVAGQVRNPGAVPITSVPIQVTDALAQTGGALQDADLTAVRLTRQGLTVNLDLDRLFYEGLQGSNVRLQHGDVLTVPDRQSQKVYVLGEVTAPKSYILRRGLVTLAEALSDAGGPNATAASTAHIYVLRLDAQRQPIVYHLDGRSPESFLLSQSFPVQAGDVVVVNPTAVSRVSRLVNQFFPLLSETALVRSLTK